MDLNEEILEFTINKQFIKDNKVDFTEDEIKDILRDIIQGIDYLHLQDIVHRDIKPDNILMADKTCKITDFNVSSMIEGVDRFKTTAGTMYFYAPEECFGDGESFAGKPLDIWALGVTLYIMIYRKLPFYPKNEGNMIELLDIISEGKFEFDDKRRVVSNELKELILMMLERDPTKRATIVSLKLNKWINNNREDLSFKKIEPIQVSDHEIKNSLKFFFTIQKTKKIANIFKNKVKALSLKRNSTKENIDKNK